MKKNPVICHAKTDHMSKEIMPWEERQACVIQKGINYLSNENK